MDVIKRDGSKVEFVADKIRNAIQAANKDVDEKVRISKVALDGIVSEVILDCEHWCREHESEEISVEEISDIAEEVVMDEGYFDVARSYIKYRYLHSMVRDKYKSFMGEIAKKLNATDIQNQNANIDEASFGGRQGEASNYLASQYALDYCVSKMARENHLNNEIYIHDLSSYAVGCHNCLTIPFDDLLAKGFNTRQTDVRPAQSISTAFQLVAVIFQIQSLQQFGK